MEDTPLPHVFRKIARRQNVFFSFITVKLKTKHEIQRCLKIQRLSTHYTLQTRTYFITLLKLSKKTHSLIYSSCICWKINHCTFKWTEKRSYNFLFDSCHSGEVLVTSDAMTAVQTQLQKTLCEINFFALMVLIFDVFSV